MLTTYCLLSTAFFVLYFLFQGLQSVGEKLNDLTRTCETKKPYDENSFAQRCKRQIKLNTRKHLFLTLKNCARCAKTLKKHIWKSVRMFD